MGTAGTILGHTCGMVWDLIRWSARWWKVLVVTVGFAPAVWYVGNRPDIAITMTLFGWLLPGLVCTAWPRFWPNSWFDLVVGPLQRRHLRAWAKENWTDIAKACGLSTTYIGTVKDKDTGTTIEETRWQCPPLRTVRTTEFVMELVIDARRGQTSRDITAQAEAICAACKGVSATGVSESPSRAVITVVLIDHLAEVVESPEPVAGKADPVVIGRYATGVLATWDPTRCLSYAIQGMTRSGKSSLCYGYLSAVAYRSDVIVCGIDKGGILLSPFTKGRGAPWIVTTARDGARVVATLDAIVDFSNARVENLLATGKDKLTKFDADTPVILVVLDEYPGLIKQLKKQDDAQGRAVKDRVAPKVEAAVGIIAAEGAKAGVVLMILSQRMSSTSIDTDTRSNLPIRATFRVDKREAVRMLHDAAETADIDLVLAAPQGRVLYEAPGVPMQLLRAYLTDYETYLPRVARGLAATSGVGGFRPPTVLVPEPAEAPAKSRKKEGEAS